MKTNCESAYYGCRHSTTVYAADAILPRVLNVLPAVHSAVDFGCGVGTWLSVLKEKGVEEILGLDGHWVNTDLLEIPKESFRPIDFEKPFEIDRRYDLAISLEVAEHLQPMTSSTFVKLLTSSADFILFSAAIPYQGGSDHVNEQWPDYWVELFNESGYAGLDFIRREIWNDAAIPFWYRQNVLLFVKKERLKDLAISNTHGQYTPIALIHPDVYVFPSVRLSWRLLVSALKRLLKKKLRI